MSDVTQILNRIETDPSAASELLPLVYEELRMLAATRLLAEKPGQTLQATALVHEAYLRIIGGEDSPIWNSRGHFFSAAAEAMRRILIDQARKKQSLKAGGARQRIELTEADVPASESSSLDLLALDEALSKLETQHPRKARLVKLRYFAGLTNRQAAEVLGISTSTSDEDWRYAKSWLRVEMTTREG